LLDFVLAFAVGGGLAMTAQLVMDLTPFNFSPAHVMVMFVVLGVLLSGIGVYQPLVDIAGAGATIPLTGFGHALAQGVLEDLSARGAVGILSGALRAAAVGLTTAVFLGYVVALVFNPKG